LPGLIGERLFTLFDTNKDDVVGQDEFLIGAGRLLSPKFEDSIRLVFDLFDFDHDQSISREDIRTLLSSVPLTQILADKKSQGRKEGTFTQDGGG
jgi:Ca2+-binding EF-hand superfamily protein